MRARSCMGNGFGRGEYTYQALDLTDFQIFEDVTRFITVANVLKGLGSILTGYIEDDFFTAPVG